jgi:hypothetical protein
VSGAKVLSPGWYSPRERLLEARAVQRECELTEAQARTLANLDRESYERLCVVVVASGGSSAAIGLFLDRCARPPEGRLLSLTRGSRAGPRRP